MSDEDNKTEEPTGRRLEEARKKGQVAYTKELGSTLGLFGMLTMFYWTGTWIYSSMKNIFEQTFGHLGPWVQNGSSMVNRLAPIVKDLSVVFGFILFAGFFMPLIGHAMQKGIKPNPEAALPTLEKINPLSGAKNLFSSKTFADFGKNFLKTIGLCVILYVAVKPHVMEIAYSASQPYETAMSFYGSVIFNYLIYVLLFLIVVIMLDYTVQRYMHRKKLRMTKQEVKDENKDVEGNPEIKNKVREIARERSRRQIDKEVPSSTVIITNPTHFAVALRYNKGDAPVPRLVAKGVDNLSRRIREIAQKHQVPVIANPPLARAIYRDVKVGEVIPRKFYKSVAKILATIFRLNEQKKQQQEARNNYRI